MESDAMGDDRLIRSAPALPGLCRDCGAEAGPGAARCPACGSRRLTRHAELHALSIAHIDCDAFYASVEKRDDPKLADLPVIVGGGQRGVVAACCYVARLYGVRSAMPMFKALSLCPHAVVLPPDMKKYQAVGREVRARMLELTPLVQPLSIDEAFLDLTGTERLHGGSPARTLIRLVRRLETEIGITASIGLSYNKFLAKVASDLDKPRGFKAIGRAEALDFLAPQPVGLIWGVGAALQRKLEQDGIRTIAELRERDEHHLMKRYGVMGRRLYRFARGEDLRTVDPDEETKSISAETTFNHDIADLDELVNRLWPLCETVARRLKAQGLAGGSVVLKLKTAEFRQATRSRKLGSPTQMADAIFQAALPLLEREATGIQYRLIGIGCADLAEAVRADPPDLLDPDRMRRNQVERAMDQVRERMGDTAVVKGRGFVSRSTPLLPGLPMPPRRKRR
ncbi:DNA polymerase IV [Skermanella mucosa]|uniref:DNA polymerase IV n=1 Tax=Skermanella mucosa TaxID=1789672 RepID=UPI001E31D935|nr:DNA polymerase IV [Skermanella mucosa]UEM22463.1 DNA polymerase IV [Skermanella mucosa]